MVKKYLVFSAAILFLSGCATFTKGRSQSAISPKANQLEVSTLLKFDDLPVPDGFKFIANESFAFQTQGVRVGLLKYEGRANPDAVVKFYKDQMPLYNWKVVNLIEYGRRVLNFEKNGQTAVVTIDAKGNRVSLTLAVSPRSESSATAKDFEK